MQMGPIILGMLSVAVLIGVVSAWAAYRLGKQHARRAVGELASINEIGQQMLRTRLNLDELCELIYQRVGDIVPDSHFQLGLFDGDTYQLKVWAQDGRRQPPVALPEGGRKGLVGWVREIGQPLVIEDLAAERERLPALTGMLDDEEALQSGLFVPLVADDVTIGMMAVQSRQPRRFTEEHLRLFTALANQAAWAIRHAQLYEQSQYRAGQLRLIGEVIAQISAVQPLPELLRQIVTLVKDTFGYYAVGIFVYEGGQLRVGASTDDVYQENYPWVEPGEGMIGWAARTGQTALANNVGQDERYRPLGALPETRSEIALPLRVEERVLGVLDVQSSRSNAFSPEDVSLLETLAAQVALAVQQAQSYDAERRLAQRLEALTQVSQAIASVLDLDDLLDRLVDLIGETFGFERVHIFIRLGDVLVFRAGIGPHSVHWMVGELAYSIDGPGLIPKAARTGGSLLVGDVSRSEDYRPGVGLEDTRSEMTVPIQMAGIVMGVLDVQSRVKDAFTPEDLHLMESLADAAAVAIRNATLYANERRRRTQADSLREVSATLASELDFEAVVAETLRGLWQVVAVKAAALVLIEEQADRLTVYAAAGPNLEGYVGHRMPLDAFDLADEGAVRDAIRRVSSDLLGLPKDEPLMIVPLTVGGTLIGYLVGVQPPLRYQGADDLEIAAAFANQAGVAISNARLYAAQQAEVYVTTVLLQVAEAVNAQVDALSALETIARLTALLVGVSRCLILRWEPGDGAYYPWAQYGVARDRFDAMMGRPIQAERYPLLELLTVTARPLGAGQGHHLPIPEPLAALLMTPSVLCLPLRARSGLVGLLVVDDPPKGAAPRLLSILTGIAHQTATVIETAHLQASAVEHERLEQELAVARTIQASFMPGALPQGDGWRTAAVWRAARQVGGDFYDFIPLQSGLWGLVIADVADKGMPAALFMAVCRTLVRAAAASRTSPAATLVRVNELLFNDGHSDLFVTLFYAVWNPATATVTYASAGHNPALLVRREGREVIELPCRGIALGVVPQIELEEQTVILEPGDAVVAYTDGVTEAMRANYAEWGLERLKRTLLSVAGHAPDSLLHHVLHEVDRFVGDAPQNDDLTLWVLQREADNR